MYNYREVIESKGITQAWIGRQLGVSRAMVNMFLNGRANLAPEKVEKLNNILNIKGDKV